jgi:hypothetical protein
MLSRIASTESLDVSPFNEAKITKRAMDHFETQAKRTFRSKASKTYIPFADPDKSKDPYVKKGTLMLPGFVHKYYHYVGTNFMK